MKIRRQISAEEWQDLKNQIEQAPKAFPPPPMERNPASPQLKTSRPYWTYLGLICLILAFFTSLTEEITRFDWQRLDHTFFLLALLCGFLQLLQTLYQFRRTFRSLKSGEGLRELAQKAMADSSQDTALEWIHKASLHLPESGLSTLNAMRTPYMTGSDLIELSQREWLKPVDQKAMQILSQSGLQLMLQTALSPWFLLEAIIFMRLGIRTMTELCLLYGLRPSRTLSLRLFISSFQSLIYTGASDLASDSLDEMLGGGILTRISQRLGQGAFAGFLLIRLGIRATEQLRPAPEPHEGYLRKLALDALKQEVQGRGLST